MATYKVLQDIEAEDKLLGPLTLKQFIFAIIFLAIGFIEFKLATLTGLSVVRWPIVIMLLIPFTIFGFLAAPISRDQPNDVWLLARIRFLVKPHVRIWNQSGVSQLVTITVPKKIERILTDGMNQHEVRSRLSALASTLDSRGWATKNVDVNMFAQPGYLSTDDGSDRLVAPSNLPINDDSAVVGAADDIMDELNNPTAQHLDQMVQQSAATHRQQVLESVRYPGTANQGTPNDYWFLNQSVAPPPTVPVGMSTFQTSAMVAPGTQAVNNVAPSAEERAIIDRVEAEKETSETYYPNLKTLQPLQHGSGSPSGSAPTEPPKLNNGTYIPYMDPPTIVVPSATSTLPPPSQPTTHPTLNPQVTATAPITSQDDGRIQRKSSILNLANNDDLNIATIARQAKRMSEDDGEVVISLH